MNAKSTAKIEESFKNVKKDIHTLASANSTFAFQQKDFNHQIYQKVLELEKDNLMLVEELKQAREEAKRARAGLKSSITRVKNELREMKDSLDETRISAELRKVLQEA